MVPIPDDYAARAIAFFLPQFHPVPENDAWWGPGFTEWTNAAKARPLYPGHQQPTLPADLGFYDLRLPETREAQSALAAEVRRGGVLLLALLVRRWPTHARAALQRGARLRRTRSVSFCLGWANQTWTGIWHGAADRVLMRADLPAALRTTRLTSTRSCAAFRDDRYLRVDGRPVFYVFRPEELPDAAAFVDRWQAMAASAGLAASTWWRRERPAGQGAEVRRRERATGSTPRSTSGCPAAPNPRRAADACRRKALRGLEVYPYAGEPLPLPAVSTRLTTCRLSIPTGTTRRVRAVAAS